MRNKVIFILTPVILAIMTWIWLFYENGRWYYYRQEWPFLPLLIIHLLLPLFYFVVFLVRVIRHVNKDKRSASDIFYIVSSIVLTIVCCVGLLSFLLFTSGA